MPFSISTQVKKLLASESMFLCVKGTKALFEASELCFLIICFAAISNKAKLD